MLSEKWVLRVLSSFITDLHNSNKPLVQITLDNEKLIEERFFFLGFVKGEDIQIERRVWFMVLDPGQIDLLNECLKDRFSF